MAAMQFLKLRSRGRRRFTLVFLAALTAIACSPHCPDLEEQVCDPSCLYFCNECGISWACIDGTAGPHWVRSSVPCECITDGGQRLRYDDTGDTSLTTSNDQCDSADFAED